MAAGADNGDSARIRGVGATGSLGDRGAGRLARLLGQLAPLRTLEYRMWVRRFDTLQDSDRAAIRAHIGAFSRMPLISVVMPTYETPERLLREAIDSVRAQLYQNWELCVADDASKSPVVCRVLAEYASYDPRVRFTRRAANGNISLASNSALELARGEFVALMDHDDLLPEHALYEVAALLQVRPDADIVYSDEDKIDDDSIRFEPYFKTDWNPELFLGHNMISHLGVYRRSLIEAIGGFRAGFEGSQDYDLALRACAQTCGDRIHHIPAVLYHWRQSSKNASFSNSQLDRCIRAARRAKAETAASRGQTLRMLQCETVPFWDEARREAPRPLPRVSVIVPARDGPKRLRACLNGLLWRTDYASLEIAIVAADGLGAATRAVVRDCAGDDRVSVVSTPGAYDWPAMVNACASQAKGDILVVVDPDVEPRGIDWLTQLVTLAVAPDVGVVGPKLLHEKDKIRSAGLILGLRGVASTAFANRSDRDPGYFGRAALASGVSAVSDACFAVRKTSFDAVGGMNARELKTAYAQVDFCLRLAEKGWRSVWTPLAVLSHHDHRSREIPSPEPARDDLAAAEAYMRRVWRERLNNDPFYSPNLSLTGPGFELAFPPRRLKPWLAAAQGAAASALAKPAVSS